MVRAAADGADLLVHESTFMDADAARAQETGHSTAGQAARTALEADVGLLALTHISTRYMPREVREEAQAVFDRVVLPRDFDQIVLPLPEKGEPHLVPWEGGARLERAASESL